MGTIKASEILHITKMHIKEPVYYLETKKVGYGNPGLESEEEAQSLINEWDKLEHYKAQVKQLREALGIVKDYIEYPGTHKGTTRIRKAVEQVLKETE